MSNPSKSNISVKPQLSRDMGFASALSIGVGTMIAAGIFTLSGLAVRDVGSGAILAFLIAAFVALLTAMVYCEFSAMYPESGGGYLYARRTFSPPLAYFVGWTLLIGYTSSCAFYIASLSSYFQEFVWHSPFEEMAGLLSLGALILLNIKGTKETARFQIFITAGKVILLLWFVTGGFKDVNFEILADKMSYDFMKIGSTAGLVFITFFGFSAIAASAGEVRRPIRNIPRAIFWSLGIVTVLYTLVIIILVAADLNEYTEASLGNVAKTILGPVGGMVIVLGSLFSMISASNASILASSRIILSMSQLGQLPEGLGAINPRTRTPIISLLLVGALTMELSRSFELENLAHFADLILLLGLVFVNIALIYNRKKFPKVRRPFRVPFVPVFPIIATIANIYLIFLLFQYIETVFFAIMWLLFGVLGFFAWKGFQVDEEALPGAPSLVAESSNINDEDRFRVLVPISNPANMEKLLNLASSIANDHYGEVVVLRVLTVPEQFTPRVEDVDADKEHELMEKAHEFLTGKGVSMNSVIRIAHNPARAILETSREWKCNLILLGWKGYTSTANRIMGEVVDDVAKYARANILLAKIQGDLNLDKILIPTSGGTNSVLAEKYASSLLEKDKGLIHLCSVVRPNISLEQEDKMLSILLEAEGRIQDLNGPLVDAKLVKNSSVTYGIIDESENYDAIMIGASRDSFFKRTLGSTPERIARNSQKTVFVVKQYSPVKGLFKRIFDN